MLFFVDRNRLDDSSCVLLGVGIGRRSSVEIYSMSRRVVKRKVTLEITEEYDDGGRWRDAIEVTNVDSEDKAKSAKQLTEIALSKLGEKKDV